MESLTVSIFGAGKDAVAYGLIAARKGHRVLLWDKEESLLRRMDEARECEGLDGHRFPDDLRLVTSLEEAAREADLLLLAEPVYLLRERMGSLGPFLSGEQIALHMAKGVERRGKAGIRRVSEIVMEECCIKKVGALVSPSTPVERLSGEPGAAVMASPYREVVARVKDILTTPSFQVFQSPDLVGVELGAALTEVFAIACGVADGLGYGSGTRALIVTRSLTEMARIGEALGAQAATFSGFSGLGCLVSAVGSSEHASYAYGLALGGERRDASTAVPSLDGLQTVQAIDPFVRRRGIPAPILTGIHEIVTGRRGSRETAERLVRIEAGREMDAVIGSLSCDPQNVPHGPRGGEG